MRKDEADHLAALTGQGAQGLTRAIEDTHVGITDQVYGAVRAGLGEDGRAVAPIHAIHRTATKATYAAVRFGLSGLTQAGRLLARHHVEDGESVQAGPRARRTLSFVNGVVGDHLAREGSALAVTLALRHEHQDVTPTPAGLTQAFGTGQARLAVFVHGVVEDDTSWGYRALSHYGDPTVTLGSRLHEDLGLLPLYLRYNSGLRISTNGAQLSTLLDELVNAWPGGVEELVLIGHSMGGLVIASAFAQADGGWPDLVRAVVTLGSPHDGAPLARGVTALAHGAERIPQTRWLSGLFRISSDGLHDLRHGNLVPADWEGHERDDPGNHRTTVPPAAGPRHFALYGSLTRGAPGWLGDGLVPVPDGPHEAVPAPHDLPLPDGRRAGAVPADVAVLPGLNHQDLLNHPRVYDQLRDWLRPLGAQSTGPQSQGAHPHSDQRNTK